MTELEVKRLFFFYNLLQHREMFNLILVTAIIICHSDNIAEHNS